MANSHECWRAGEKSRTPLPTTDRSSASKDQTVVLLYGGGNETGLQAGDKFARRGATVIIADNPAAETAVAERVDGDTDFIGLDPCDLSAVRTLAERVRTEYTGLDVLASTKSVAYDPTDRSGDLEQTLVANHLAVYQLVHDLYDMTTPTSQCRIFLPVSPLVTIGEIPAFDQAVRSVDDAVRRSHYANAAFVARLHNGNCHRTAAAYDPSILVHDDSLSRSRQGSISASDWLPVHSTPDAGARRLVQMSSDQYAGAVSGVYCYGPPERLIEHFEDSTIRSDAASGAVVLESDFVSIPRGDRRLVWEQSAQYCQVAADWYEEYQSDWRARTRE